LSVHGSSRLETGVPVSREIRDERAKLDERLFYERTQPFADVVRTRIRELRKARRLSGTQLAAAMTAADVPMTKHTISRIETGGQEVGAEELFVFAQVLDVPLARLVTPRDGDRQIRVGDVGLSGHDVATWLVYGMPDGVDAMSAGEFARLGRKILRFRQLAENERDPSARTEHMREVVTGLTELLETSDVYARVRKKQWRRRTQRSDVTERRRPISDP
jgi:transcriptional regulator with XRE-family HTH domain